ncbi:hypothetical protein [Bacillus sp. SA1-12]|nr:hypothetical protein [Bacillus sp. SA1-12]
MVKTVLTETEIILVSKLYFEENMTVEEIERITPFDYHTLNLIIEDTSN